MFRCECPRDFTGDLCQHSQNKCKSSPCSHGGTCINQDGGFQCLCQPGNNHMSIFHRYFINIRNIAGFSGDSCELEYNECGSDPCLNGGECTNYNGKFLCICTKGFEGERCQVKVEN